MEAGTGIKGMIFAAGLGTRLRPLTDSVPKALVKVGGMPLVDRVLVRMASAGISPVVVNIHHHAAQLRNHLLSLAPGPDVPEILISDESDDLLDTGGGLMKALPLFGEEHCPVLLHNVDIVSDINLKAFCKDGAGLLDGGCAAVLAVSDRPSRRKLLFRDGLLCGWQDLAAGLVRSPWPGLRAAECRALAFSGIHIIDNRKIDDIYRKISREGDVPGKKFSITDFYLRACRIAPIRAWEGNFRVLDAGRPETLDSPLMRELAGSGGNDI